MKRTMKCCALCLAITVTQVNSAIAVAPPQDIDVVTKLAEFRPGGGRQNLDRLLKSFEEKATAKPYTSWLEVKPVLESPDVLPIVKMKIFSAVLVTADASTVKSLIAAAAQWSRISDKPSQSPTYSQGGNPAGLCNDLLSAIATNEDWRLWAIAEPTLQTFLVNAAIGGTGSDPRAQSWLVEIISKIPLESDVKSGLVEEIILRSPRGAVRRGLFPFLNSDSISRIREALRLSIMSNGYLHFGAIEALVEIGDLATLPILANQADVQASLPPQLALVIPLWTERITVQHPPSQLLQWIADPARATIQTWSDVRWAIQRAVEHGIEPELIRLAVLQHADNVRNTDAAIALPLIKETAMNLGVLHPDDLKDVVKPLSRIEQ